MIYAVPLGLLAGRLLGGRLAGLATMRFRWAWLAIGGLAAQVILFGGAVDRLIGAAGPALYVASTVVVLIAVLANLRLPGLPLVALGAASNLAAILANGGSMPADPGAYALAGLERGGGFSNSVVTETPALPPLTDIYALPDAFPFANVFSIGDVLIAVGIAVAIAAGMRRARPDDPARHDGAAAGPVRAGNSPD
ncbi:MAG: DUF5317 domain-containing protein [Chloroflexi bacterium]|nr:DUF5317 domain-containing protein [Chloroflexota bacterium]